jgi:hypothetical protein
MEDDSTLIGISILVLIIYTCGYCYTYVCKKEPVKTKLIYTRYSEMV